LFYQLKRMKHSILLIAALLIGLSLYAQTRVQGSVKDKRGRIIAGANISIKGSYDGTTSDSAGNFSFKTYEKGAVILVANTIGFKMEEVPVTIGKDTLVVDFLLKEEINELSAVVITAGTFEASDKKKGTVLKPLDIATTAGANADISATIQTLPGAQKVGEQEGLFIRGGSAEEAKIIIDGSVVNNFF